MNTTTLRSRKASLFGTTCKASTRASSIAAAAAAAMAMALASPLAHAENHALIMWIGNYANPSANLKGIDIDAANARKIALAMGVSNSNITEVSNEALTHSGITRAFEQLAQRIARDDKVFLYYSGHGSQRPGQEVGKCTEGMFTHDMKMYEDVRLEAALRQLGNKAAQVVMMNDSCFSGGAATKAAPRTTADMQAKFYDGDDKASSIAGTGRECGDAVNSKMTRSLEVLAAVERPPQVLYIAASAANEVSFATPKGSTGTLAWASCIRSADTNGSGSVDGEELRQCAQKWLNANSSRQQTITLVGNSRLPLSFTAAAAGAGAGGRVNAQQALNDIRAGADPSFQVILRPSQYSLRVGQDEFNLSLTTNRSGYVYIFQVGSDGKTFNLLFPNKIDSNNQINAGTHSFPRPSWRVRAAGPAGTSYVMAYVSPTPKDFAKAMDGSSTFASLEANELGSKTLEVISSGASTTGGGRYGASDVVAIRELN